MSKHTPSPKIRARAVAAPFGSIVAAALVLPGVFAPPAHAESAPEHGVISLKTLHYEDSQPGLKRITVDAPSVYLLAPINSQWAVEASGVVDNVSGASPRWHSAISSASRMHDERTAGDFKVMHYRERSSYSLGLSHSAEHDYVSDAISLGASFSSDDNNTTLNLGLGASSDKINPVNLIVTDERKRTQEFLIGVTRALSSRDILQANLTYSSGKGYYDDPYKMLDARPRSKQQTAVLLRWNHALDDSGAALRTSYRYYADSYQINAHTVQAEWVKPLSSRWTLTPLARYYTQNAASFFFPPVYDATFGAPYPAGFNPSNPPQYTSADQRLSAFGGVTLGLKVEARINKQWTVDAKVDRYEQRGSWRLGGSGTAGIAPFRYTALQVGLNYQF